MTVALILPALALLTPAQIAQPIPPAPVEQTAPAPTDAPTADQPQKPATADQSAPELRDPLSDPAVAVAAADQPKAERDPLEGFNRAMFRVHQKLDKALYRPAAMGYKHLFPKPVRSGLRNFFDNLAEPVTFLNYMLQLKPKRALRTLGRFAINTTVGVGGLMDLAKTKHFKLPYAPTSFGDTMAYYGVGPGPYLFIPFVGPTTLRDLLGGPTDALVLPILASVPFGQLEYQAAAGAVIGLDKRVESDDDLKALLDGAVDPYATLRSAYLQDRAAQIEALHSHPAGRKTTPELNDPLRDPGAPAPAPTPAPAAPTP